MSPDIASLDDYRSFATRDFRSKRERRLQSLDNFEENFRRSRRGEWSKDEEVSEREYDPVREWKRESPSRRGRDLDLESDFGDKRQDFRRYSPERREKYRSNDDYNDYNSTQNFAKDSRDKNDDFSRDYNSADDYKNLSAQDFRKTIMQEERLAVGRDDESITTSQMEDFERRRDFDNDSTSVFSFNEDVKSFNNEVNKPRELDDKERQGSPARISSRTESTFKPEDFKLEEIIALRQSATNGSNQEQLSKEVDDELMRVRIKTDSV